MSIPRETLVAGLVLLAACARQQVTPPDPPDMQGLVSRYAAPTAALSEGTAEQFVGLAVEQLERYHAVDGLAPVLDAVLVTGGTDTEATRQALRLGPGLERQLLPVEVAGEEIEGDGFVRATRICAGWDDGAPDAEANGSVTVTVVFSDEGFDPVVWGEADQCRYLVEGQQLFLDGSVKVHTGTLLTGDPDTARVLVDFDGTVKVNGAGAEIDFDFRLSLDTGELQFSLTVDDQHIIYWLSKDGEQGFVDVLGTWTCDFAKARCEGNGQVVEFL